MYKNIDTIQIFIGTTEESNQFFNLHIGSAVRLAKELGANEIFIGKNIVTFRYNKKIITQEYHSTLSEKYDIKIIINSGS